MIMSGLNLISDIYTIFINLILLQYNTTCSLSHGAKVYFSVSPYLCLPSMTTFTFAPSDEQYY